MSNLIVIYENWDAELIEENCFLLFYFNFGSDLNRTISFNFKVTYKT